MARRVRPPPPTESYIQVQLHDCFITIYSFEKKYTIKSGKYAGAGVSGLHEGNEVKFRVNGNQHPL